MTATMLNRIIATSALRWQGLELLNLINLQKMNKEQNVDGLNVSPAIAKPFVSRSTFYHCLCLGYNYTI
jgi:hypothetical protein